MGLCPCPRCLIKKTEISALGTMRDDNRRAKIRVNNKQFCTKVSIARGIIYKQGYQVNTDAVNILLKEMSLVPITVCPQIYSAITSLDCAGYLIECVPHSIPWSQHLLVVCCGSDA